MAPWRVSFATRVGTLILEASEFTSSANIMKPTATDAATARVQPVSETETQR
jgi:hypothetical protein